MLRFGIRLKDTESMRKHLLRPVFSLLILIFSVNASAEPLKILGRGLMDRSNGDSIALACLGYQSNSGIENCQGVQFVRFTAGHPEAVEYLGQPVRFADGVSDEAKIKYIQGQLRNQLGHRGKTGRGLAMMTLSVLIGGGLAVVFNVGVFALAGVAVWPICATKQCDPSIFDPTTKIANAFTAVNGIQDAVSDRDGWSWSSRPRKVNHKNFARFETAVRQ
jgi:hypothetical protein